MSPVPSTIQNTRTAGRVVGLSAVVTLPLPAGWEGFRHAVDAQSYWAYHGFSSPTACASGQYRRVTLMHLRKAASDSGSRRFAKDGLRLFRGFRVLRSRFRALGFTKGLGVTLGFMVGKPFFPFKSVAWKHRHS